MKINKYIDHTLLKASATKDQILKLCEEAKEYNFYAVCVNGCNVSISKNELKNSNVKIAAVVGFPLGANTTKSKVFEAKDCIENGATEIDMVINIGKLLDGDLEYVENEIRCIKEAIKDNVLKVILENCYLTKNQIKKACELALNAGADFVKTSTGFGISGSNIKDVLVMKNTVKDRIAIKAAGGIRDIITAEQYIEIGVNRLGTSSGVSLVTKGVSTKDKY